MKHIIFSILFLLSWSISSSNPKLVLLKPTGNSIDGLTEMEIIQDTSKLSIRLREIIEKTVIKDFIEIHDILQIYLFNTTGKSIEPAYLSLTDNQGGYAVKGFVLIDGEKKVFKENSYYVDIKKSVVDSPYEKLMSITQLYPHELGHIMYRLLSSNENAEESSKNVNVHFYSLTTDYQIAFNEGFAEHLENISRLFETNESVIKGIKTDTLKIAETSYRAIDGFTKDFKNSLRFGFYKISMLAWYQQFEDYKRFAYSINGNSKYTNATIATNHPKKNLIYRNAGVRIKENVLRNKVQLMATEGTISTFFTLLSQTEAKNLYQSDQFYSNFLKDSIIKIPIENQIIPLQNLFMKYFFVLDKYVDFGRTEKAHLIDFIEGYLKEFPVEESIIKSTYKKATGLNYNNDMPSDLWIMIKEKPHGVLAMDAYAGLSIPVNTFSLNAAELEDFMMIENFNETDAVAVLNHREQSFFDSFEDLNEAVGLSDQGKTLLLNHRFDSDYFNNIEFPEELNIMSVIKAPLKHLILNTLIYFVILMIIYFLLISRENLSIKKTMIISLKFFPIWILMILSALIIAASAMKWYILLLIAFLLLFITYLIFKGARRNSNMVMISLMTASILVSLI